MKANRIPAFCSIALAALLALAGPGPGATAAPRPARAADPEANTRLQPLFDTPLRDPSICRGGDGKWYLTGAAPADPSAKSAAGKPADRPPPDFQDNDGVWLWSSADCKTWTPMGQVWSIEKNTAPNSWQRERRPVIDPARGRVDQSRLACGMVSPEIHYLQDTYWITYSMNGCGTGLLKSATGKPEGPYQDLGRFTADGTDASLFQDDDGSLYWLVGEGWLAKLKPDCSGLAAQPQLLRCASFEPGSHGASTIHTPHAPRYLGMAGAHLFKENGVYYLVGAHVRDRIGVGCYDTFVAFSQALIGPYSSPHLMIAHGGQSTVFKGPDDRPWATFGGRDCRAVFRDRPAILPLEFGTGVQYGKGSKIPFPGKPRTISTEFGPWDKAPKVQPYHIRDLQFSFAPDGCAYLTGSGCDPAFNGKIMLYRSKDLRAWEIVDVRFDYLGQVPGATAEDREIRFGESRNKAGLQQYYMDSEVYYLAGTFHIFTSLYGTGGKKGEREAAGGALWLRSTTGKPEGPYEYVAKARAQSSVFVDDDGATYLFYNGNLLPFDPKGNTLEGAATNLKTTAGTGFTKGDVATNLLKAHGKYLVFGTGWCGGNYGENYRVDGTYDWVYWQADRLAGPYEMPRRAFAMPHGGHSCQLQRGPDGRWFGLFFGNDSTGPWNCYPGVLVFDLRLDPDGTIRIELEDALP